MRIEGRNYVVTSRLEARGRTDELGAWLVEDFFFLLSVTSSSVSSSASEFAFFCKCETSLLDQRKMEERGEEKSRGRTNAVHVDEEELDSSLGLVVILAVTDLGEVVY